MSTTTARATSVHRPPPDVPVVALEKALYQQWFDPKICATKLLLSYAIFNCRARGGVIRVKRGTRRREVIALWSDGKPIGRPDRLLRQPAADRALETGKAVIEREDDASPAWGIAVPLPLGPERSGLLYLTGVPVLPRGPALRLDDRELDRWAAYAAAALALDEPNASPSPEDVVDARPSPPNPPPPAGDVPRREHDRSPAVAVPLLVPEIVGQSPEIRAVHRSIALLSRSDIPVLIEGESGTGKELVARAVHRMGRRAGRPFVTQNCGAIPAGLVEAELFGHDRGAFTGAQGSRAGIFERALGGTVFLDEVGEMDLETQKRLLRVLQSGEIRRLGGREEREIDFRVVSATNRVLEESVERREFREDLYYRLNVATIHLPPLRARKRDIALLLAHFAHTSAEEHRLAPLEFAPDALAELQNYSWPGNVRELRNEVWRLNCTTSGTVQRVDLSERILRRAKKLPPSARRRSLPDLEKELLAPVIENAVQESAGNRTEAARRLGITRADLYRRMRRYGTAIPTPRRRRSTTPAVAAPPPAATDRPQSTSTATCQSAIPDAEPSSPTRSSARKTSSASTAGSGTAPTLAASPTPRTTSQTEGGAG